MLDAARARDLRCLAKRAAKENDARHAGFRVTVPRNDRPGSQRAVASKRKAREDHAEIGRDIDEPSDGSSAVENRSSCSEIDRKAIRTGGVVEHEPAAALIANRLG